MREAAFWNYLRKVLPRDGHFSRIESETSAGFPDVHYTLHGTSGTIELKSTKNPKAKFPFRGKDGLRPSQIRWIKDEIESEGRVLIALQCARYVYIVPGGRAAEINNMTQGDLETASMYSWVKRKGGLDPELLDIALRG